MFVGVLTRFIILVSRPTGTMRVEPSRLPSYPLFLPSFFLSLRIPSFFSSFLPKLLPKGGGVLPPYLPHTPFHPKGVVSVLECVVTML